MLKCLIALIASIDFLSCSAIRWERWRQINICTFSRENWHNNDIVGGKTINNHFLLSFRYLFLWIKENVCWYSVMDIVCNDTAQLKLSFSTWPQLISISLSFCQSSEGNHQLQDDPKKYLNFSFQNPIKMNYLSWPSFHFSVNFLQDPIL